MCRHEGMKFQCAFHLSFQQLSCALQPRDKDGLQPLVLVLYLQGDAYYFHQILMKDPFSIRELRHVVLNYRPFIYSHFV
jgi:hypothetical protein